MDIEESESTHANQENVDCQIKLEVNGHVILMSRNILITNSAYFEAIFEPQHAGFIEKENKTLVLQDFETKPLKLLLSCLKPTCKETELGDLSAKMSPTLFYLCVRLMIKCDYEKIAIENLSYKTCYGYLQAAENTGSKELFRAAQFKMFHSFGNFRRTNAFKRLEKEDLKSYLSSRHLTYKSTKEILEAIIWWLRCDFETRSSTCMEVLALAEWGDLSLKQTSVLKLMKTVQRIPDFKRVVDEIYKLKSSCDSDDSDANALLTKAPRSSRPLVLLVEAEIISKISQDARNKEKHRFFSFYDVEASKILDDYILVENFPEGCAVTCYEGNLILFGGIFGITTSNWNKEIKAYNLFTKKWKTIGRMIKARRHFELAQDGSKFYLIGGTTTWRLPTTTMEVFDFADGTVKAGASMVLNVNYPFPCCWSGNSMYVFDSTNSTCPIYSYEPRADSWKLHLPFLKVVYGKMNVALSCGTNVYLTGYDCPIVLRKNVKNLRKKRLDTSMTYVNDTELFPNDVTVLSFFVHDSNIYSIYETEECKIVMDCFNTKTASSSHMHLEELYANLEMALDKSAWKKQYRLLRPIQFKPVNAAWL